MFFVTLLLNEIVAWMRGQSGTTSLRALFYMDEVFGFFPPSAMPPSKLPLLTLMKQARAFGLGVVLATQNPVDLDYKGLGNAGTWLIGRLQTERDRNRVIDGLLGTDAAGGMDRSGVESLISNLAQRTILMRNVHDDAPVLFRTRWALSFLRGPLTLAEIRRLTPTAPATPAAEAAPAAASTAAMAGARATRPVVEAGVTERYVKPGATPGPVTYQARIGARVRAHFVDAKSGMNAWEEWYYLAPVEAEGPDWSQATVLPAPGPEFDSGPVAGAAFADVPASLLSPRQHKAWADALEDHVYRNASLNLMSCPELKLFGAPGGTEGDFRVHIAQALREKRDAAIDALRGKYGTKLVALQDRERRAEQKVERERTQATSQTMSTALSIGGSLLGALFGGRRRIATRQVSTAARSVGRATKERADVASAEADAQAIRTQIEALNAELDTEITRLQREFDPATIQIVTTPVQPRKSDLSVEDLALVWCP
jgi:hypothetical protein